MIEKIETWERNGYEFRGDREKNAPNTWDIAYKINEIIDHLNNLDYYPNKSPIDGTGIFTGKSVKKGQCIGVAICQVALTGIEDKDFRCTALGKYLNHSSKPNCKIEKNKKQYLVISKKDIGKGEELTIDYRKLDISGNLSFLSGEGKQ